MSRKLSLVVLMALMVSLVGCPGCGEKGTTEIRYSVDKSGDLVMKKVFVPAEKPKAEKGTAKKAKPAKAGAVAPAKKKAEKPKAEKETAKAGAVAPAKKKAPKVKVEIVELSPRSFRSGCTITGEKDLEGFQRVETPQYVCHIPAWQEPDNVETADERYDVMTWRRLGILIHGASVVIDVDLTSPTAQRTGEDFVRAQLARALARKDLGFKLTKKPALGKSGWWVAEGIDDYGIRYMIACRQYGPMEAYVGFAADASKFDELRPIGEFVLGSFKSKLTKKPTAKPAPKPAAKPAPKPAPKKAEPKPKPKPTVG